MIFIHCIRCGITSEPSFSIMPFWLWGVGIVQGIVCINCLWLLRLERLTIERHFRTTENKST